MNKQEFETNLKKVYGLSNQYEKNITDYFSGIKENNEKREFLDDFLDSQNLPKTKETRFVAAKRLIKLNYKPLIQFLKNQNTPEEEIFKIKRNAYKWVKDFYENNFQNFIEEVEQKDLLPEFYLNVLQGTHEVGKKMNKLELAWSKQIHSVNKGLEKKFGDKKEIIKHLRENNLLDKGHYGIEADRCYSVLVENDESLESRSYFDAFDETKEVVEELKKFKETLRNSEDDTYDKKDEWVNYVGSLVTAFSEIDTDNLVKKWSEVDAAWMKVNTPLQIVHPFEYYNDPYRKAVSIEWDLRIQNFGLPKSERAEKIKEMYGKFFNKFGKEKYKDIYEKSIGNVGKTQLYLSKELFFYASKLDSSVSAQVIPNDEEISKVHGKKIFAFPEHSLEYHRTSPFSKLGKEIYEKEFLDEDRKFLFNDKEKWLKVYDIGTVGHEFGHILWKDDDTEVEMNKTGNFKNIEEFKATSGGMMSFFHSEEQEVKRDVYREIISRAVGLIARKETPGVHAYYCEGLLHLTGLFESGVINFDGKKIKVDLDSEEKYEKFKNWNFETYEKLAQTYLDKKDASTFLDKYVKPSGKSYLPINKEAREFVEYYYKKYEELGNQIDESVSKEDYIVKD